MWVWLAGLVPFVGVGCAITPVLSRLGMGTVRGATLVANHGGGVSLQKIVILTVVLYFSLWGRWVG